MSSQRQLLGRLGENLACAYVRRNGWLVLDRNWRCRTGELDLVALDGSELVICEVRTRRGTRVGTPLESVTPRKIRRLRVLAGQWVQHRRAKPRSLRIDVIGITVDHEGHYDVTHVRGVQ